MNCWNVIGDLQNLFQASISGVCMHTLVPPTGTSLPQGFLAFINMLYPSKHSAIMNIHPLQVIAKIETPKQTQHGLVQ